LWAARRRVTRARPASLALQVGMHVWPDNWGMKSPDFQKSFIESHLRDVATLGKPVILEEFGKITEDKARALLLAVACLRRLRKRAPDASQRTHASQPNEIRNKYFAVAHAVAEANAKAGGPLMGTLFWHWCVGREMPRGVCRHFMHVHTTRCSRRRLARIIQV
jgi:mannan endo-1,4-beta-mannosidase